ncbi:MAG TPA: hydroxyethylthiazole kinase [Verrucomicrobia bacterium]|nr:hydroxyethylthiazole kinase [Verrucomicrobiota bacterium]
MKPETHWSARAAENLKKVRETRPLVHNITNYVVMNFTANVLLAAGASPVMAHAENEVEEMVSFAKALVLNIGTLEDAWIASMIKAGKKASALGVPIILDPVGAGATKLRTETAKRILAETRVSLVRGNASEILALGGAAAKNRGVDSADSVDEAADRAVALARELGVPVAITGAVDFITDGNRVVRVANGHPLMGCVTGTGCGATAIIGAFAGVDAAPVSAAATALAYYGLAGEHAADGAPGPGSFAVRFLDALHGLTAEEVLRECRIQELVDNGPA